MFGKYRNVKKMIAHFDNFIADVDANPDEYVGWQSRNRDADWNSVLTQKSLKKTDEWLATLISIGRKPSDTSQESEQMQELLDEKWDGDKLSRPELLDLIRKYPPEILEEVLPCVMVMYILRETDVEFDSETQAFSDFFDGWHRMVVCTK